MTEEARLKQREYMKVWRSKNKDKIREYNRRYWQKKAREADGKKDAKDG